MIPEPLNYGYFPDTAPIGFYGKPFVFVENDANIIAFAQPDYSTELYFYFLFAYAYHVRYYIVIPMSPQRFKDITNGVMSIVEAYKNYEGDKYWAMQFAEDGTELGVNECIGEIPKEVMPTELALATQMRVNQ